MTTNTLHFHLALWRIAGIGPVYFNKILTLFPDLEQLFRTNVHELKNRGIPETFYSGIANPDWKSVEQDLRWAEQTNHHIITQASTLYPTLLKNIDSAPPLLFVMGDVSLLTRTQLALVGSRNPTTGGADNAYHFAKHLAANGFIITSGLALGIDASAHEGALMGRGKTIAVMGTGPDQIYPRRHHALAKKIIEQGALVTEFPTGVAATANNFPRRNRIISGLSVGTLVIEAAISSGSLITAQHALEQNREVFAIPGSIHNPLARGCHQLLRQGAKLVETAQDILDELGMLEQIQPFTAETSTQENTDSMGQDEQKILKHLGFETTPIDMLIQRSGLTAETVSSILLHLELQGKAQSAPGGYVRIIK